MNKKFGISVYISTYDIEYIKKFNKETLIFLSLHIPEEMNNPDFKEKSTNIISEIKSNGYKVICDISPKGLELMGYDSLSDMVNDLNIDYLRLDFGYEDQVSELNKITNIIINASTLNEIKEIPKDSIFMHNFYLRRDTGLSLDYFNEMNNKIKVKDGKVFAFIPGDKELRGPIFEKLSTLEKHRDMDTFISFLDMYNNENVDGIFIGDISLKDETINNINTFLTEGIINIKLDNPKVDWIIGNTYTIRSDSGENCFRINESRWTNEQEVIEPLNNIERPIGTVTIDNHKYKRYMGEIQITKANLSIDERVNVIGSIPKEYTNVLNLLSKVKFV